MEAEYQPRLKAYVKPLYVKIPTIQYARLEKAQAVSGYTKNEIITQALQLWLNMTRLGFDEAEKTLSDEIGGGS